MTTYSAIGGPWTSDSGEINVRAGDDRMLREVVEKTASEVMLLDGYKEHMYTYTRLGQGTGRAT